ncbi:MAG: RIP metalloprotease RseP [Bacteroidales bacterium]|nr:RIP metalloprotease RseP [Bacteroidales bacterium]
MIALSKTLQVILALSILILAHELGHFTFAKLFKIRVDKFFLFFDLGGKKLFSTRSSWFVKLFPKAKDWETEYGIGWCPLGGYCKINGMIDESFDLETMKQEPKEYEFRTKPAWQRLLVMAGGVLFNFIAAIIIYSSMLAVQGRSYIQNQGNKIYVNELAYEMGFRNGDEVLKMDGRTPEYFNDLQATLARKKVKKVTVLRGADTLDVYIDQAMIGEILNSDTMFDLAVPFVIDQIQEGSPNKDSGLRPGDRVTAFEGRTFDFVQDCQDILADYKDQTIDATVLRGSETLHCNVQVDSLGKIGVALKIPGIKTVRYNALSAIPAGIAYTWEMIVDYVNDLRLVATPSTQAYKSVGSFIAIGQVFPSAWDWNRFLNIMAMLSIMLGVMNLLPIPGLDGGHILFTLYEMVTRRKPSDRFMVIAQMVGMILLFALMFLAFGNDISRLFKR